MCVCVCVCVCLEVEAGGGGDETTRDAHERRHVPHPHVEHHTLQQPILLRHDEGTRRDGGIRRRERSGGEEAGRTYHGLRDAGAAGACEYGATSQERSKLMLERRSSRS